MQSKRKPTRLVLPVSASLSSCRTSQPPTRAEQSSPGLSAVVVSELLVVQIAVTKVNHLVPQLWSFVLPVTPSLSGSRTSQPPTRADQISPGLVAVVVLELLVVQMAVTKVNDLVLQLWSFVLPVTPGVSGSRTSQPPTRAEQISPGLSAVVVSELPVIQVAMPEVNDLIL